MLLKIKINRGKLKYKLDRRDYKWLHEKLLEMKVSIKYPALTANLRNEVEWKLLYAYCICQILNCTIDDMFYLDNEN